MVTLRKMEQSGGSSGQGHVIWMPLLLAVFHTVLLFYVLVALRKNNHSICIDVIRRKGTANKGASRVDLDMTTRE